MMSTYSGKVYRSPFTANQWQEFEHQTLIYKYMISGVPVPPELIFPVKRSLEGRLLLYQQPSIGWGCFGLGRKADPEPGRCRRTDGKKWRCSKEAYPGSKYCTKHMHRGRNRSRKPVELAINNNSMTTPTTTITNPTTLSISHKNTASASNSTLEPSEILYNPTAFMYYQGMKESMNERDSFTDSSGSLRSIQDSYQQLRMGNSYRGYHHQQQQPQVNINYSFLSPDYTSKQQQQLQEQQQHCYILGADLKSSPGGTKSMKLEKDSDHSQKPLQRFFSDQWTPKSATDCWLDLSSSWRSNTGT